MIDTIITLLIVLAIVFIAATIIRFAAKFLIKIGVFAFVIFVILHLIR